MTRQKKQLSSSQVIILGFACVVLLGSIILMQPVSAIDGSRTSFLDALFTAASSVCVTGLVVKDTATYWSFFGQAVILMLIQIGGMGVVTIAIAISVLSGKSISLKQRSTMQEAISAPKMGGIVKLTGFIIRTTLLIELLGACIMAVVFCREFGFLKGLWYGVFHSISAFCNAGFDLMGIKTPYSSLTDYAVNPLINMTVMALIITGGIGFMTWDDIKTRKHHLKRYRMQSKVILVTTLVLIVLPALYFFLFEFVEGSFWERVWGALFQSVTPRTAGFNTRDLTLLSETGIFLMIILMLIGGSPGSTAGGMKTTTFAVLISTSISVFKQKDNTHFFGRRISDKTVKDASTILMMYLVMMLSGGFIICKIEGLPLLTCLFEAASAIGTVGLSLGVTPGMGAVSKIILIVLMYVGRVGGLTLIFSAVSVNKSIVSRLPEEKVMVG